MIAKINFERNLRGGGGALNVLALAILEESRGMFPWTSICVCYVHQCSYATAQTLFGGPRGGGGGGQYSPMLLPLPPLYAALAMSKKNMFTSIQVLSVV